MKCLRSQFSCSHEECSLETRLSVSKPFFHASPGITLRSIVQSFGSVRLNGDTNEN